MTSVVVATPLIAGTGASVSGAVSATAGNALIVGGAALNTVANWTVTRTGDTYTTDTVSADASASCTGIASGPNVSGGSVSMTITSTGANGISGWATEVNGPPTSAIRDATSPAATTGTSTAPASNSLTNATADAIFFCAFASQNANTTVTPGTGWTDAVGATTLANPNGNTQMVGGLEFQIVSSTGAQTGTWTLGASAEWRAVIAVYKGSASGGAFDPSTVPWPAADVLPQPYAVAGF